MQSNEEPAVPVTINTPLVRRLIRTQFPHWAALPIRPVEPGGWDNRTFHLGDEMSVRLPSAAGYVAQVEKEHRWLPRLAPHLPLPIPVPLARGEPAGNYPWPWSVYRWLPGRSASLANVTDLTEFALALAAFLRALQQIDPTGGPPPGPHNFFRGGSLTVYDGETRQAIRTLTGRIDTQAATAVWESALQATWYGPAVWLHGDVSAANLLVENGRLSAVIDFGGLGVGDPACDLTIAWTFFSGESREAFRAAMPAGADMWARARGWALWKALITLAEQFEKNLTVAEPASRVINDVLAEHQQTNGG